MRAAVAAVTLVGLLTLGEELDRLVEALRYEEAGVMVAGVHVMCARVTVLEAGGLALAECRAHPSNGTGASE